MNRSLRLIIEREYTSRVKRKSFIITTLLVPIFMAVLMVAPAAIMALAEPESATVAVVDNTGQLAARLHSGSNIDFIYVNEPLDSLRENDAFSSILVFGEKAIAQPEKNITFYSHGSPALPTMSYINSEVEKAIKDVRLEAYNIPDIKQILAKAEVDIDLPVIRIDKEEDSETSAGFNYFVGLALDMMLYMFILIYGQMVMTSIIEEKNNRVLEIVVSSVKPSSLMLGKITGIGLVAVTQILIWSVIFIVLSLTSGSIFSSIAGDSDMGELTSAFAQAGDTFYVLGLIACVLLFFIGGFMFYATIWAAIGSAVDNVQDASQLSTIATLPVIIGVVCSMAVLAAPDSTMAMWVSIIPFTSPMTMMSRLPYGVPAWQIAVSLVVLYASFLALIYVCAKIYRVGIFMYGKKPTLAEIIRWTRYK